MSDAQHATDQAEAPATAARRSTTQVWWSRWMFAAAAMGLLTGALQAVGPLLVSAEGEGLASYSFVLCAVLIVWGWVQLPTVFIVLVVGGPVAAAVVPRVPPRFRIAVGAAVFFTFAAACVAVFGMVGLIGAPASPAVYLAVLALAVLTSFVAGYTPDPERIAASPRRHMPLTLTVGFFALPAVLALVLAAVISLKSAGMPIDDSAFTPLLPLIFVSTLGGVAATIVHRRERAALTGR